jgi:hypothetical protein
MRGILLSVGVASLAFAATAVGAPPRHSSVTIAATGNPITIGSSSTISGVVSGKHVGGVTVTLEGKSAPYSGAFAKLATTTSDSTGHYSFNVAPQLNTKYEAVAKASPTAMSSDLTVSVRVRVTKHLSRTHLAKGQSVRFSGLVEPAYTGKSALIQRKTATGWRTIARAKLMATTASGTISRSRYSKRVKITRSGTFRVMFNPADGLRLANSTGGQKVTVH